jgi:hypothetical protein
MALNITFSRTTASGAKRQLCVESDMSLVTFDDRKDRVTAVTLANGRGAVRSLATEGETDAAGLLMQEAQAELSEVWADDAHAASVRLARQVVHCGKGRTADRARWALAALKGGGKLA